MVLVKVFSLEEMLCCWFATKKTIKTIKQKNIKRKTHKQTEQLKGKKTFKTIKSKPKVEMPQIYKINNANLNKSGKKGIYVIYLLHLFVTKTSIDMTLFSAQVFLKGILKELLLPYLNFSLRRGFPLPVIPYMELRDSNVEYGDGFLLVCTNVEYKGYAICEIIVFSMIMNTDILCLYKMYNMNEWVCYLKKTILC